jgi:hypothetical protein
MQIHGGPLKNMKKSYRSPYSVHQPVDQHSKQRNHVIVNPLLDTESQQQNCSKERGLENENYSCLQNYNIKVSDFPGNHKFLAKEHSESNTLEKKEIEYWQITTKEAVKFRPCTETFIKRD